MFVLGIETSCDETAAAVVEWTAPGKGRILSDVVKSQTDEHALYGGVVPEIAARAHIELADRIVEKALVDSGLRLGQIDGVAATAGPGLIGGVIVGLMTAKALAQAANRPLIAVNHLEGHALTARLTDGLEFPFLLLLVSGGHTQILVVEGVGSYRRLGTTIDDALGEAFDKTAKMLGLGYPGGPEIEKAALAGDALRFAFPRPLIHKPEPDFSFSGLKTAVRQAAEGLQPVTARDIADIAASFQETVSVIVADRVKRALAIFRTDYPGVEPVLVVAGGVAANRQIRASLLAMCEKARARLVVPPGRLCTDNGVMIAWAGAERLALGESSGLDAAPRARWPLDDRALPRVGSGRLGTKV